jgi:hypothetical protein
LRPAHAERAARVVLAAHVRDQRGEFGLAHGVGDGEQCTGGPQVSDVFRSLAFEPGGQCRRFRLKFEPTFAGVGKFDVEREQQRQDHADHEYRDREHPGIAVEQRLLFNPGEKRSVHLSIRLEIVAHRRESACSVAAFHPNEGTIRNAGCSRTCR